MADDKKAKRRLQNVEAAKRSYETKKKERNELEEKNTSLVAEQMALLLEKSRLENQVQFYERLQTALEHTCSDEDDQQADCLRVDSSTCPIFEVTMASPHISSHIQDDSDVHYNTLGVQYSGYIDQSETVEAVKNLQHHSNIALDLSAKTGSSVPPQDHSRSSSELSDQETTYNVEDCLNIGATQEVEHTTRRRKNRRQDGGMVGQNSVVKKNRREGVSPNSCARFFLDSKRGSQITQANGRRFSVL